jgi:hypothetical protein
MGKQKLLFVRNKMKTRLPKSQKNKSAPSDATIRLEYVKCGKTLCKTCSTSSYQKNCVKLMTVDSTGTEGAAGGEAASASDTSGTDSTAVDAGSTDTSGGIDTGGGDLGFDGGGFDF